MMVQRTKISDYRKRCWVRLAVSQLVTYGCITKKKANSLRRVEYKNVATTESNCSICSANGDGKESICWCLHNISLVTKESNSSTFYPFGCRVIITTDVNETPNASHHTNQQRVSISPTLTHRGHWKCPQQSITPLPAAILAALACSNRGKIWGMRTPCYDLMAAGKSSKMTKTDHQNVCQWQV